MSGIAQQLGFATIPACSSARSPLTSGTTSGMPGCSRNADDLSMHRAPAAAAAGTSSRLNCVPIEKKQTSRSPAPSASAVASSTSRSPSEPPAERLDANVRMFVYPRSRRYWSVTRPTAPVAPTIPIRSPDSIIAPVYGCDEKEPKKTLNRLTRRPAGSVGATYFGRSPDATPSDSEKAANCARNVAGVTSRGGRRAHVRASPRPRTRGRPRPGGRSQGV